jgi:hypothetical protein
MNNIGKYIKSSGFSINPILFIASVWFISRVFFHFIFSPTITPDSREFIQISNSFFDIDPTNLAINRPFGYSFILFLLNNSVLSLVILQNILTLLIGIQLHLILKRYEVNKRLTQALPILFMLYPLTAYLEFQVLSETYSTFLMISFINFVTRYKNFKVLFTITTIFIALIVITRPNMLILVIFILVALLQSEIKDHNLVGIIKNCFKVIVIVIPGVLLALCINLNVSGKITVSDEAFKSGIAMHFLDAIPSYQTSSGLSQAISDYEFELRKVSPGSKYWAVQNGSKSIGLDRDSALIELDAMDRELIKKYPLLYLQSVTSAFFSPFTANVNAYLPNLSSYFPTILGYIFILSSIMMQTILLFGAICVPLSVILYRRRTRLAKLDWQQILVIGGVVTFLLVNSLVSPIEQVRYLYPAIPILILILGKFWSYKERI